jgi:xylulokinase
MPRVLGVDSSTQSTKVELRDADDGALLASGRAPHPPTGAPPVSEQHPDVWWDALGVALRDAGIAVDDADAVAVAAQQHGMVALDASDAVIRPAILWNDTRAAADADWLVQQLDGGAAVWAAACGSVPLAAFTIAKLSWLHRKEPDSWARLARVVLPHDWLTWRLTGERVTDRGDASGTGYWSPEHDDYALELLAIVDQARDWTTALPRVCGPREALVRRAGDGVVAPGTGDNMAAALGIGLRTGEVAISIGTSGTVYARATEPTRDGTGAVAGFADATGAFLPLVCTLNASKVTDAIARLLGVDHARLDALALDEPAGAGGTVVVPYFDGERTPNRPDATGTITGMRSDVTRQQLARAAFEGVVCGLLDGLDALIDAGVDAPARLALVGGGARSAAYRQVLADLAQRPVAVFGHEAEHVAAGACVQAAMVLHQTGADEVVGAWGLHRDVTVVDPQLAPERAVAVRAAYSGAALPMPG